MICINRYAFDNDKIVHSHSTLLQSLASTREMLPRLLECCLGI